MFSIADCDTSGTTGFVNANDFTIFTSKSSSSHYFWISFVIGQEAMSCFNHPCPYFSNLALDSNSSGKQPLDSKSAIFSTPGT